MATIVGCLPIRLPTISGRSCTHFCKDTLVPMRGKRKSVAVSSRQFTGFCAPAHSGVNCQPTLASGTPCLQTLRRLGRERCLGRQVQTVCPRPGHGSGHARQYSCTRPYVRRGRFQKGGRQHEQCLGRSRGGFSSKIHLLVDALGFPLQFILTGGERHDLTQAESLLAPFHFDAVIADKGYRF